MWKERDWIAAKWFQRDHGSAAIILIVFHILTQTQATSLLLIDRHLVDMTPLDFSSKQMLAFACSGVKPRDIRMLPLFEKEYS